MTASITGSYIVGTEPNVSFTPIVSTGDALPGVGSGVFGGIPDGIGAFDNGDGTITILVNHELTSTAGITRDHGSIGSYIDRLVVDKTTLQIVEADDAIQTVHLWDALTSTYVEGTTAFSRFCSADLADATAYFNAATGLGTDARIYLTGEESGVEGRAVATIVSGDNAGHAFELPALGNLAYENLTANPLAQDLTIIAATDDGTNGQVYIYVGEKQASGNEIERAGLTNGAFYGIKVTGVTDETNDTAVSGSFVLDEIGVNGDVTAMTGAQIDAESELEGVTSFLRPEDSAWDPQNPNVLYFTTTNSFTGNSRLYRATFADISNPQAGGTIEAVLDGSEGQHMFDNMSVANGKVILQEDPGNQSHLARIWEYDIATDTLNTIAEFDPALFTPGSAGFITQDEESSGVIDVTALLGDGTNRVYLLDAQVHAATGDPATVEPGQLLIMSVETPHNGTNAADVLNGDASANTLSGYNGNDTINGGSGNDTLSGDGGQDTLIGAAGDDTLRGGRANDSLDGGADNDTLLGGLGGDIIVGGDGNDRIVADAGNDRLTGGTGADTFDFATFEGSVIVGRDVITDFTVGEDVLAFGSGVGIAKEVHGDFDGDTVADTRLILSTGGNITLLGVADIAETDVTGTAGWVESPFFHAFVI